MTTAHGICKKCGKEAVHLAMSGLITFCGDQDNDFDNESIYADELITPDDVSVGIHVCYKCGHVEGVWVEHPHENETITTLRAEVARLTAELAARTDERDHYAAACSRIDQALAEARGELGQWRDAFSWVEQHVGKNMPPADG